VKHVESLGETEEVTNLPASPQAEAQGQSVVLQLPVFLPEFFEAGVAPGIYPLPVTFPVVSAFHRRFQKLRHPMGGTFKKAKLSITIINNDPVSIRFLHYYVLADRIRMNRNGQHAQFGYSEIFFRAYALRQPLTMPSFEYCLRVPHPLQNEGLVRLLVVHNSEETLSVRHDLLFIVLLSANIKYHFL
jgi:hypothetical protein